MKRTKETSASKTGRNSHQTEDDVSSSSSLSSFEHLKPVASQDMHLSIDDPSVLLPKAPKACKHKSRRRILQAISLSIFLITWVANGEVLQIISTGRDIFGKGNIPAYDKPFAITWVSYNYMLLGICSVILHTGCTKKASILYYVKHQWPGRLGLAWSVAICAGIAFVLQFLNVLFVVGLGCVSVSLSNAIFQLQTVFTVGLSVGCLQDKFVMAEAVGILLSIAGVACIVLPPLLFSNDEDDADDSHEDNKGTIMNCSRNDVLVGVFATLISAAIGGAYLVAWRVLDEVRHGTAGATPHHTTGLDGLVDTQMTLAMIGFCNLTLGWILLPLAHVTGLETMELPPSWWLLHWNGVVEFSFDASTAVAIYMTSPVVVAIVSPLTIPLASLTDRYLLNDDDPSTAGTSPLSSFLGVVIILAGIVLMELKPDIEQWWWQWQWHHRPSSSKVDSFDKQSNGDIKEVVLVGEEVGLLEIPKAMYDAEKQV